MELWWLLHNAAHDVYTTMGERRSLPTVHLVNGTFPSARHSMVLVGDKR